LDEFLPIEKQLELEHKQREEEDTLYRKFLQERRENEDVVANLEENDRIVLEERMNKMERSRIINLADKHCSQILDLIHRLVFHRHESGQFICFADSHTWYICNNYLDMQTNLIGGAVIILWPILVNLNLRIVAQT